MRGERQSTETLSFRCWRERCRFTRGAAFTLAEVLITLGIIGVVAAMTLPALINKKAAKELQTALKKNYSIATQALMKMNYDEGIVNGGNYAARTFEPKYVKYFKVLKDCKFSSCVVHSTNTETNDVWEIKNYKTYNKSRYVSTSFFDDGQFVLNDGSFYMIENPNFTDVNHKRILRVYITIDVNGYKKGPNAWGHDLFTFQVTNDGKLLPMGTEGTDYTDHSQYCSATSSEALNGISCAAKAINDKDYFNNLP